MKRTITKGRMWTKEEIRTVLKLWDTSTREEIAEAVNRSPMSLQYIAAVIRKSGYDLPKKHKIGTTANLVKETLRDLKLIR